MREVVGMVTEYGDTLRLKVMEGKVCLEVTVGNADVALERVFLTPIDALTLSAMLTKAADAVAPPKEEPDADASESSTDRRDPSAGHDG